MVRQNFLWTYFLVVFCCIGCSQKPEKSIDRIVFITIDTLRRDHLSCYGYPRLTSPFIDSLAHKGILFQKAFSHVATTVPSHSSMFTSLYPLQHNVRRNRHRLDDSFLTLAETLSYMDFQTAGFVSFWNFGATASNLSQGFDFFDDDENRRLSEGFIYRKANKTIDAAINWLVEHRSKDKFFLWIHLFDPHSPYYPPKNILQDFKKQTVKERESRVAFFIEEQKIDFGFYDNKSKKLLDIMDLYDSEIFFADSQLKRLYEHLEESGLNKNSLWIVTSDHGEGLGNHRWRGHGKHIYNEQVNIPLIFHFPSSPIQSQSINQVVEQVDILPTILDLVGADPKSQNKKIEGISLAPLILNKQKELPNKPHAFSQRKDFNQENPPAEIIHEKTNYEIGEKYALQDGGHKYIHRTQGEDEFYNLGKDPYEVNNLIGSNTEEENNLRSAILTKIKRLKEDAGTITEIKDKKALEQLKSLGYVQ